MPIATNPNNTYEYCLAGDRDLPKEKRPLFCLKYLTLNAFFAVVEKVDQVDNFSGEGDPKEIVEKAAEVIRTGLIDWKNMTDPETGQPLSFDPERIGDLLTLNEAMELMRAVMSQMPNVEDKKKLDSPSPSGTGRRVKGAGSRKSAKVSRPKPKR